MPSLLEQIKRELKAVTEIYPLPWSWWKCGDYERLASGNQTEEYEYPIRCVMDDGSAGGEYSQQIAPDSPEGVFIAHAPAFIDALLPVVEASLALDAARDELLALAAHIRPTEEWETKQAAAWGAWCLALEAHDEACRVFKEAKNANI